MDLPKRIPGQPNPVIVSYSRFSKPEQAKGDSIRRQTKCTEDFAQRSGLPIDESLSATDRGISAFRGKNSQKGALAYVLECVESGRIWPGCYLAIENLDRISRQEPDESLMLLRRILKAEIRVVTFKPTLEVYDENSSGDTFKLMSILLTFSRAHEESKLKSGRLCEAWMSKRDSIQDEKMTSRVPAWIKATRDKRKDKTITFALDEARAAVVKRIHQLCIDGSGVSAICKTLNTDNVPTFGKAAKWPESTVRKILGDRSAIGEHQPHKLVDGVREPVGDPITGYFPAAIDEELFYQSQQARDGRKMPRGRRTERVTNLFGGLIWDGRDGTRCEVLDKGEKTSGPSIAGVGARLGGTVEYIGYPYRSFESVMLAAVQDIDLKMLQPPKGTSLTKQIAKAESAVLVLESKIAETEATIKSKTKGISRLLALVSDFEIELEQAREHLESLKRQQATPAQHSLKDAKSLIESISSQKGNETRKKLRSLMPRFVSRITVIPLLVGRKHRALLCSVKLASGKTIRIDCCTGDIELPSGLVKLDLRDWANWPSEFKGRIDAQTDLEAKVLELGRRGYLLREIKRETGVGSSSASRILKRHGLSRTTRKPRDSDQLMTWNANAHGWQKTKNGERFYVGVGTLKKLYPRMVKSKDRDGTAKAANRWWREHGA